jgi:hypothetical protein
MAWIETTNGYVNLATAQSATKGRAGWSVRDASGVTHELSGVYSGEHFLMETFDDVVPASGNHRLHQHQLATDYL